MTSQDDAYSNSVVHEIPRPVPVHRGDASLFILHPDDVPGTALHPDSGRRGGCCGLHGQHGPNLVCADCGAEVATKESDCWTDNLVALIAAAVVGSTESPSETR